MLHVAAYGEGIGGYSPSVAMWEMSAADQPSSSLARATALSTETREPTSFALAHSDLRTREFGKEDDAKVDAANLITVIIQETEWCKSRERCRLNLFTPLALKCGEDAAVVSTDMSTDTE